MITLAEIDTSYKVNDKYNIRIGAEKHLIICVPVPYGSSAAKFDHPNIASVRRQVLEFKHYSRSRGKFWTRKPGLEYFFIVPKSEIYLDETKSGSSYVYIEIGG